MPTSGPQAPVPPNVQHRFAETEVNRNARACYELFASVQRTPEWLPEVRSARVRHFDHAERPAEVDFMASADRGGLVYALRYRYDPDQLVISWESRKESASVRRLEGTVRFDSTGPERCLMVYEVFVQIDAKLPEWAHRPYHERSAEQLCSAFKEWAKRQSEV